MPDDSDLRRDLVWRIETRRAAVQAFLRNNRPRIRRRATLTVVLSSLAALFTAGPAFGGETFSTSVQNALGLETDETVWRLLCLLALLVSVGAAVLTNLGKSQDDIGRLSNAEAAGTELEGLSGLLQFGHLTVEDAVKLYQQYSAKIPFVDDGPGHPVAAAQAPGWSQQAPGPYGPPAPGPYGGNPYGGNPYGANPYGGNPYGAPPGPGNYPPPPPHG